MWSKDSPLWFIYTWTFTRTGLQTKTLPERRLHTWQHKKETTIHNSLNSNQLMWWSNNTHWDPNYTVMSFSFDVASFSCLMLCVATAEVRTAKQVQLRQAFFVLADLIKPAAPLGAHRYCYNVLCFVLFFFQAHCMKYSHYVFLLKKKKKKLK